jgi:hexaprenyl-diphosphate synthase
MAQATNGLSGKAGWERVVSEVENRGVDDSLSENGVLNDWNPETMGPEGETSKALTYTNPYRIPQPPRMTPQIASLPSLDLSTSSDPEALPILPTQRRLASITEMIHVASLLHDDVIDTSPLRRGEPSAPQAFGNKLSILSGDFLLGRASVALARLGSREVVELLATVIANLVEGEVMQLKATSEPEEKPTAKGFEDYMRKTYLKSASLLAKSARAAVILGGCGGESEWVKDVAYGYGRNLGMAFQVSNAAIMARLNIIPNLSSFLHDLAWDTLLNRPLHLVPTCPRNTVRHATALGGDSVSLLLPQTTTPSVPTIIA